MAKLRPTISIEELLTFENCARKLLRKTILACGKILEKYFGTKVFLEIQEGLIEKNPALFQAMNLSFKQDHFGVIKTEKTEKIPDEPFIHLFSTRINNRVISTGSDFFSEEDAYWKSLAEGIERYTWYESEDFFRNKTKKASFAEVRNNSLDIGRLAGFTEKQKREISFLSWDKNTRFEWIRSISLISGEKTLCPLQLVSSRYFKNKVRFSDSSQRHEPMLRWAITTGLATGQSLEEAVVKGALEVIERDAFMITYLNKLSPKKFDQDLLSEESEKIKFILSKIKRYSLEIHILKLPTDFPLHITLAIAIDRTGKGPAFSLGARADFNLEKSIIDALTECTTMRIESRRYKVSELDSIVNLKVPNRLGRIVFWSKFENLPEISFLTSGETLKKENWLQNDFAIPREKTIKRDYYRKKMRFLSKILERKKYEAVYVEITHPKTKPTGLRTVNVIIPELQPMHLNESVPYFGGKRLREIPEKLGFPVPENLNAVPHPFP